jgi:hypothetical protein
MYEDIIFDFEKNQIFVNGKAVGSRYKFYDIHKIREEYNKIFNDFEMKDYSVYDPTVDKKLP